MRSSIVILCLVTMAGAASAQTLADTITAVPGHRLLEPERLVPHRVTWRVTQREPDGSSSAQGLWTDMWVRSLDEGRPVFVFHQLFVDTAGAVLVENETVFEATSLRGIRSTQQLPPTGTRLTYRYAGDTVSGTLRRSTESQPVEFRVVFKEPIWEPLAPVSILLPLERLESGAVMRYPVWNQVGPGGDVAWREIRVDSVGRVATPDGRNVQAWHLTAKLAALNTVTRLQQSPDPPYYLWFDITSPARTREWTLVDWEPFVSRDTMRGRSEGTAWLSAVLNGGRQP